MEKNVTLKKDIEPAWENIKIVILEVKEETKHLPTSIVEKIIIACTELLENSIKYGVEDKNCQIDFLLEVKNKQIQIIVSNRLVNEESVHILKGFIDLIKISNTEQLYLQRLREIVHEPISGYSQFGLYRIVHEAEFNLEYSVDNHIVTITASRKI